MKQGTKMVVWGLGLGLSLLVMKIGFFRSCNYPDDLRRSF